MSDNVPLSDKQCLAIAESNARINVWQGAVRSGKTYSSLLKLIMLLRNGPPGNCMIVGVTRDSIQRNIITEICSILGVGIPGSRTTEMRLLGRMVYMVGANDESAVRRIQGSTLALAYVDEATEIPEPFWHMLLSRLSVPGAQLLATLNPSGPLHWFKQKFLDRAGDLDIKTWHFLLDDNPALDAVYVDNLKKEYSGMWYKRYILGEWAVAEGLIYDQFDSHNVLDANPNNPIYTLVGIDYGTTNPTAAVLAQVCPNRWPQIYVADTYYYDSAANMRSKTAGEYADDLARWLLPHRPRMIYCDPSAAPLKLELQRKGLQVIDANNDVLPGIQVVSKFLGDKSLVVDRKCSKLIEELHTYSWDSKAAQRGEDKPIKHNDHLLDSLRYLVFTKWPRGTLAGEDKDYSIEAVRRRAYAEANPMADMLDFTTTYM